MDGAFLLQLLVAIGGSSALTGVISWLASRRKNSADVAEVWNRLTGDALERDDKEIKLCQRLSTLLTELARTLISEMDSSWCDVSESRARLRDIEAMRAGDVP